MNSHELNREGRKRIEAELLKRGAATVTQTIRGRRRNLLARNELEPESHRRNPS